MTSSKLSTLSKTINVSSFKIVSPDNNDSDKIILSGDFSLVNKSASSLLLSVLKLTTFLYSFSPNSKIANVFPTCFGP